MKYHLIASFTVAVWGTTFVSTKVLLQHLSPLWILMLRFAIGFLALCLLRPHVLKLRERRHELLFVAAGASGIGAYYLLENVALLYTTATAVGVIVAASPLFTAILAALSGERSALNGRFFAGFALAIGGLIVVSATTASDELVAAFGEAPLFGDALALLATLVWAVYSILVKRIAEAGYETVAATKRTFFWGLVLIVPVTLLFDGRILSLADLLRAESALNLLFLGVVASAACFVTWGVSVKHLGAALSATYIYLVPAITATASALILGEPVSPMLVVGLGMTVGGLLLSQNRPSSKPCRRDGSLDGQHLSTSETRRFDQADSEAR